MKTNTTQWILASICAVLLAATAEAAPPRSRDSRHSGSHGRPENARHYGPPQGNYCRPLPPPPMHYRRRPAMGVYWAPPPPPPPVYYWGCYPPPPPVIYYPAYSGFNFTFTF